jgi:hypothetical protein
MNSIMQDASYVLGTLVDNNLGQDELMDEEIEDQLGNAME